MDENYDSDSSLTATINKSLDLGRSLGDKCSELTKMELSDEDTEESRGETGVKEEEGCMGSMQVGVECVVSGFKFRCRYYNNNCAHSLYARLKIFKAFLF